MTQQVLGRQIAAPTAYAPEVLVAVPRALGRAALHLRPSDVPIDCGHDVWNAYELAWRNAQGRPCVAMATLTVPADSVNLVESKSLKLYLGSLHASTFADSAAVVDCIARDVGRVVGRAIEVTLQAPAVAAAVPQILAGDCVDALDVEVSSYVEAAKAGPDAALLRVEGASEERLAGNATRARGAAQAQAEAPMQPAARAKEAQRAQQAIQTTAPTQVLTSQLLRTLCPVTGQPDYADVQITLYGARLQPASFLGYVAAYASHTGFHEQCVEQILLDVWRITQANAVTVLARYTRRGGIDINPWRTTDKTLPAPKNRRTPRQ